MDEKLHKFNNYLAKQNIILAENILLKFAKFADFISDYNKHTNLLSANDIISSSAIWIS